MRCASRSGRWPPDARDRHEQHRVTKETTVDLVLEVDGAGDASASTGIPFFDHMLEQLGKHAGFDLRIEATGDLEVDLHHTVEDVGIVLGTAFKEALGDKAGVRRFANALVPLDEALVQVALDLSGRPFLVYDVDPVVEWIGTFDPQLAEEFWRAFVVAAGITLHIRSLAGTQRAPRDRGVVQGRGALAARRGQDRGHRRAVHQGQPLSARSALPVDRPPRRQVRAAVPGRLRRRDRLRRRPGRGSRASSRPRARSGSTSSTSTPRARARARNLGGDRGDLRRGVVQGADRRRRAQRRGGRGALLAGVARVVVGTAAVEHPELVDDLCALHPGQVAVGLDARGREVATRGWVRGHRRSTSSSSCAGSTTRRSPRSSSRRSPTTRRSQGPTSTSSGSCSAATSVPVIASGGVGTLDDLRALAAFERDGTRLRRRDRRQGDLRAPVHRGRGARGRRRVAVGAVRSGSGDGTRPTPHEHPGGSHMGERGRAS